jgi:hypothetical protein
MKIKRLKALPGYRLQLEFVDGVAGIVDLSAKVGTGVFAVWQDQGIFAQAHVGQSGQVEWPGDIDLCPDMLYLAVTGHLPAEFVRKAEPAHA